MTTPTDVLRAEHVLILRVLDALEAAAERLERGPGVDEAWWERALEWLRTFADRNHHAKEEQSLFPALIAAGLPPDGGPVAVMLAEHVRGRALIQAIASESGAGRAAAARGYVALLRTHIEKENNVLFPMAAAMLGDQAIAGLWHEFESIGLELGPAVGLDVAAVRADDLALESVG